MKLSTRLLLLLLPTVAGIMAAYGAWALAQREAAVAQRQREAQAYGRALAMAIEYSIRDLQEEQIRRIINQVTREPSVFGILVYDSAGRSLYVSDSLKEGDTTPESVLEPVLRDGRIVNVERDIEDHTAFSVIRPSCATNSDGSPGRWRSPSRWASSRRRLREPASGFCSIP